MSGPIAKSPARAMSTEVRGPADWQAATRKSSQQQLRIGEFSQICGARSSGGNETDRSAPHHLLAVLVATDDVGLDVNAISLRLDDGKGDLAAHAIARPDRAQPLGAEFSYDKI